MLWTHQRQVVTKQGKSLPTGNKALSLQFHNKSFTLAKEPLQTDQTPPSQPSDFFLQHQQHTVIPPYIYISVLHRHAYMSVYICTHTYTTAPNLQKYSFFLLRTLNTGLETLNMQNNFWKHRLLNLGLTNNLTHITLYF